MVDYNLDQSTPEETLDNVYGFHSDLYIYWICTDIYNRHIEWKHMKWSMTV